MRVLDGAVAVFDAVAGVEPQTETVWRQANKYHVPRMCFVNKMDRIGADFYRCLDMIKDRLDAETAVIQLPIGAESEFRGVVDLLQMKALVWDDGMGEEYETVDIPADMLDDAEEWRHQLVDVVSQHDENVLEKYVGEEEITAEDLRKGLRHATIYAGTVPILCGTAFKNKGVQPLLDAVVDYLPSPLDVTQIEGIDVKTGEQIVRKADDKEPFSALAFKIMSDPYVGKLTYFRVYSGSLESGCVGPQRHQGQEGAHRPHPPDARRTTARTRTPSSRATSSRRSGSRTPRPVTRSATRRTRSCSSAWSSRSR